VFDRVYSAVAWQRVDEICYSIKMDLRETEWGDMDWIDEVQDRDQ
jgi:hypothetical protein